MMLRGRLRWEKTQKKHLDNLKLRELNKQKRKESGGHIGSNEVKANITQDSTFVSLKDEPTTPGVSFNEAVEGESSAMFYSSGCSI